MGFTKEQIYAEAYGGRVWDALNSQTRLFNAYRKGSWHSAAYWKKEEEPVEKVIHTLPNIRNRKLLLD